MDCQKISADEVKKRLTTGEQGYLLDVRTPDEYAEKHIPKSLSIPLDILEQKAVELIPDKAAPIYVYCLSGRRSARGTGILIQLGYTKVYDMGAMTNWSGKMESGG